MIQFTTDGNKVNVKIEYGIGGWHSNCKIQLEDELSAILHRKQLDKNISQTIEKIRRDAYNLGWKDKASKKNKKKTEFCTNINSDTVGW